MAARSGGRWLETIAFWAILVVLTGLLVLVGALVAGVVEVAEPGASAGTDAAVPRVEPATTAAPATTTAEPVATTTAAAPETEPVVIVRAVSGDCWVEARDGSATGPVLYAGLLVRGQERRLEARRVWLRLGAGANVIVTAGGRRAPVPPGTSDLVVTA